MWPIDPTRSLAEQVAMAAVPYEKNLHPIEIILSRSNNFRKVKRILAYVLRIASKIKTTLSLTPIELDRAEKMLITYAQNTYLSGVKLAIERGRLSTTRAFRHLWPLSLFVDDHGIIRVGGRLKNSSEGYDIRHPILLPKCNITHMIALQLHQDYQHIGPQSLLATLRQKYWPLGSRDITRKVCRSCITCFRNKPILLNQLMGNLPSDRVTLTTPFTTCACDFCGPVLTRPAYKRGGASYKTYICAFVCFATKAIHLEVVGDLTTNSFIAALRRFISRRSAPSQIYCDNATNFRGADAILKQLFIQLKSENSFHDECVAKGITFHFMPPRSPHHGGLHEAAIKSLKYHLRREIGNTILTFEELSTVVCQVEAILNSRPLTPLTEDPNEPAALTPGHFLIGKPLNMLPEINLTTIPPHSLTRWQLCQKLLQHFAARWRKEYLQTLQPKKKWFTPQDNLKPGDMVILQEDQAAPSHWPMGIVEATYPGGDGKCRVAKIRTTKGTYQRAIQRVAKLPMEGLPPSEFPPGAC
ncbi:uncharacterized protein LOC129809397 [Phlebotomus papatasi]|uniref:uncharacterized protein LOC129809397 n=1 Tax=Phlebotomus papatasi TaxID=29031 RepID=UPI002483D2B8|nr:uncharacterized protein LOC129809397 [Phlebotomus papatasi]